MSRHKADDDQSTLFGELPIQEPPDSPARRRRAARTRPAPESGDASDAEVVEPAVAPPAASPAPPALPSPRPAELPQTVDVAALTNPELEDLVLAMSDPQLATLAVAAVRTLKRRLAAPAGDEDEGIAHDPHPALVRAARAIVASMAEDDQ